MKLHVHKIKQIQKKYAIVNLTSFYVRFEFFKAKQNRMKIENKETVNLTNFQEI